MTKIKTAHLKNSSFGNAIVHYIEDPNLFSLTAIFHISCNDHSGITQLYAGYTGEHQYEKKSIYVCRYKGYPMYNPNGPSLLSDTHTIYTNEKGQPHNLNGPAITSPWPKDEKPYSNTETKQEFWINGQQLDNEAQLFYYLSAMGETERLQQFLFSKDEYTRFLAKQIIEQDTPIEE